MTMSILYLLIGNLVFRMVLPLVTSVGDFGHAYFWVIIYSLIYAGFLYFLGRCFLMLLFQFPHNDLFFYHILYFSSSLVLVFYLSNFRKLLRILSFKIYVHPFLVWDGLLGYYSLFCYFWFIPSLLILYIGELSNTFSALIRNILTNSVLRITLI